MESGASIDLDPGSGPTIQTGTSSSQPLVNEAQKLLSRCRRTISERTQNSLPTSSLVNGQLPEKDYIALEDLRKDILKVITERLKARNITSMLIKTNKFWWCLPKHLDQESQFRLLLQDPFAIGTHMLKDMLKLEASTPDSDISPPNATLFYIRTFTVRVEDLRNVLHAMLHDGFDMNERIYVWLERIEDMSDIAYITLRYCGQTRNRPWDRHVSDIYSVSLRSFFSRFLKTCGMICPSVLESAQVDVVEHASAILGAPIGPNLQELNEQVLIALFGDSVLNTEAGGNETILMTQEDRDAFDSLRTKTLSALGTTKPCPPATEQALRQYAKDIRNYVNQHPSTTKGQSKEHTFSDATENMLVRQGKPNVLSDGSAVMVTVGSDFGDTHEDDEEPFFEAGGRSVDLVTVLYNNFGHWEQSLKSSFNQDLTKHLAKQSYLPFFDFFPWFVKHKDDFKAASLFAKQYLNITKPYVLLTYGNIPTYAGMKSFQPFTQGAYETEYSKLSKANDSEAYWLKEVMGVPQMASFDGAQGVTLGAECVLIPCFHPGRVGHAGILKTLITRLLAMVSGMAWAAMEYAVTVDHKNPNLPRKQKCEQILGQLNMQLSSNHPFGQAFEKSKSEYAVAQTADWQARFARKKTVAIGKPPRGILATKVQRKAKRSHLDLHAGAMEAIGDSYELNIQHYPWAGGGDKDKRHTLIWTEDDGQVWSIGPVLLPENVLPSDGNDKRFVVFTEGGLDIRNGAGESKGDRKPLLSGNSKTETVPIASLVLTLCEQAHWTLFISHWEDVTGLSVDYVLGSKLAIRSKASSSLSTANEDYYPNSFFAGSKRGLPFTWVYQTVKTKEKYLSIINATLPAQPGDLVWLIDRYIAETLPNGGDIDLVPASVHANSVFAQVASFCMQAKYKNHPHLRTFLAFASMSEMGVDERLVPATAFTNVVEVLFGKFGKKTKTVRTKIANETRTMSRVVLTIGTERQSGVLQEIEEPAFEQDVIIEGDVTDDEGQEDMSRGQKRGFDGDDDGGESSKSGAKALKGKGKN